METVEQPDDLVFDEGPHLYTLAGRPIPGVTHILETAGLIDYSFLGARREFYLERGRRVHDATHAFDENRLVESAESDEIMGYVEGWRKFRNDYCFMPTRIEHRVANRLHGYAGTLDRTGTVRDGSEIILDIKSGVAPSAVRHQLAAYAACLPHPRSRRRRCVELHSNGTYRVIPFETADYQRDFNLFCQALRVWKNMEIF